MAKAPAEASFVAKALRLKKGMKVLDICCGTGRHAIGLARRGFNVTGLDATATYLAVASRAAGSLNALTLVRGDMRRMPFDEIFDAAYNVWTSFGYSTAADDLKALKSAARALKPGGLFLINTINEAWLRKNFKDRSWVPLSDGGYRLEQASLRGGQAPVLKCQWTILRPRAPIERARFSVRLYNESRLAALLKRGGFRVLRRLPAFGEDRSGRQLVLLAAKVPR